MEGEGKRFPTAAGEMLAANLPCLILAGLSVVTLWLGHPSFAVALLVLAFFLSVGPPCEDCDCDEDEDDRD